MLNAAVFATLCAAATPPAVDAACGRLNGGTDPLATIANALLAYQGANGTLPPAYIADPMGTPLLSWRVLLLPYLDKADLYAQLDLTHAWDDPVNFPLRNQMPFVSASG